MVEPDLADDGEMAAETLALAARGSWRSQYTLDVHTWIGATALGRLAIYLDWAVEHGALPARKRRPLAEEMIEAMVRSVLPVLRERVPRSLKSGETVPLPNQGAGLLLGASAVGTVLGSRRGRNAKAQDMAKEAEELFGVFMSHLRPDGYDGEGPVYQLNVQSPALGLTCAILEQSTGEDFFEREFGPANFTLRRWLEATCFHLISANGLMRPIDDYGYARPSSLLGFAYAAGRSGDPRFLGPVRRHALWDAQQCLWDTDDRPLSLLFWPEGAALPPAEQPTLLPESFACLQSRNHAVTDTLITWKPCERLPETHAHIDPGNVVVECNGIPLVLDGRPSMVSGAAVRGSPYCRLLAGTNTDYFMPFRFGDSDIRDQGAAALGPHNTIAIDDIHDLPLDEPAGGHLLIREETDDFTRLVVDVTAPYQSCIDLESFLREVVVYREGVCVIRDRLTSATAHEFKWRMHVRPGVELRRHGCDVTTEEGAWMSLRAIGNGALEAERIEGYPAALEGHCVRLQMHTKGRRARFDVAFATGDCRQELADLTDGWRVRNDPQLAGFEKGWVHGRFRGSGPVSLSRLPSTSGWPECAGHHVWLARRLPSTGANGRSEVHLEITPPKSPIRAWLDGEPIPVEHSSWDRLLPVQIPVGRLGESKERRLVLLMRDLPATRPPAPVRLIRFQKAAGSPLRLARSRDGSVTVQYGRWKRRLPDAPWSGSTDQVRCSPKRNGRPAM